MVIVHSLPVWSHREEPISHSLKINRTCDERTRHTSTGNNKPNVYARIRLLTGMAHIIIKCHLFFFHLFARVECSFIAKTTIGLSRVANALSNGLVYHIHTCCSHTYRQIPLTSSHNKRKKSVKYSENNNDHYAYKTAVNVLFNSTLFWLNKMIFLRHLSLSILGLLLPSICYWLWSEFNLAFEK